MKDFFINESLMVNFPSLITLPSPRREEGDVKLYLTVDLIGSWIRSSDIPWVKHYPSPALAVATEFGMVDIQALASNVIQG